jgi:hypothetical protein
MLPKYWGSLLHFEDTSHSTTRSIQHIIHDCFNRTTSNHCFCSVSDICLSMFAIYVLLKQAKVNHSWSIRSMSIINTSGRITKFFLGIISPSLDAVIFNQPFFFLWLSPSLSLSHFWYFFSYMRSHTPVSIRGSLPQAHAVFPQPRDRTRYDTTQLAQVDRPSAGSHAWYTLHHASNQAPSEC